MLICGSRKLSGASMIEGCNQKKEVVRESSMTKS